MQAFGQWLKYIIPHFGIKVLMLLTTINVILLLPQPEDAAVSSNYIPVVTSISDCMSLSPVVFP